MHNIIIIDIIEDIFIKYEENFEGNYLFANAFHSLSN